MDKQSVEQLTRSYHSVEVQEFLIAARRFKRVAMIAGGVALALFALMTLCFGAVLVASVDPWESTGSTAFFATGYGLFALTALVCWICSLKQARLTRRADSIFELSLRTTAYKQATEKAAETEADDAEGAAAGDE